jgi:hypothetical protein
MTDFNQYFPCPGSIPSGGPAHSDSRCPEPCPPLDESAIVSVDGNCPDRADLPSFAGDHRLRTWIEQIAAALCVLNPKAIKNAPAGMVLATMGGYQAPADLLTLMARGFSKPGETFVYDGKKLAPGFAPALARLQELTDGPLRIEPGSFLVGESSGTWSWKRGCLPPCPPGAGLTLVSTVGGGMMWSAQASVIRCDDLMKKLVSCTVDTGCPPLPGDCAFPDSLLGFCTTDCVTTPKRYDPCCLITKGIPKCVPIAGPDDVEKYEIGIDANGKVKQFPKAAAAAAPTPTPSAPLSCDTIKATFPAPADAAVRPAKLLGVDTAGKCSSFAPECSLSFRAIPVLGVESATNTQLISAWATNSLLMKASMTYNNGSCVGDWDKDAATYTVKSDGRYMIEGSAHAVTKFLSSGSGAIHPDAVVQIQTSFVVKEQGSKAEEWRVGEQTIPIDYIYDPSGTRTVNNCNKGFIGAGIDTFHSRMIVLDLKAGAKITGPRVRTTSSYNASDMSVTMVLNSDGQTSLAVTKIPVASF